MRPMQNVYARPTLITSMRFQSPQERQQRNCNNAVDLKAPPKEGKHEEAKFALQAKTAGTLLR